MGTVSGQPRESLFKGSGTCLGSKSLGGIYRDEGPFIKNCHAIGEEFDFGKGVRGKKERSMLTAEDLRFKEAAEVGSRNRIQATRGFIEEQDLGLMQKRADQAEALHSAGRECADLPVERAAQVKLLCERRNTGSQERLRKMI